MFIIFRTKFGHCLTLGYAQSINPNLSLGATVIFEKDPEKKPDQIPSVEPEVVAKKVCLLLLIILAS